MKNTNLLNLIASHEAGQNEVAVYSETSTLYFEDMRRGAPHYYGKSVLLLFEDPAELVRALIAIDGLALAMCVVPASASVKEIEYLLSLTSFDYLLTDKKDELCSVLACNSLEITHLNTVTKANQTDVAKSSIETKWLLLTSGTTSLPKMVEHTLATLVTAAGGGMANSNGLTSNWGLLYDPTRYAGLQVTLKSLITRSSLIAPNITNDISSKLKFLSKHKVSHLSATPTLWRRILMSPEANLSTLTQIVLGGEASDQAILDALSSKYLAAKITHVYASTEAGVAFHVSDGLAGYPAEFLDKNRNVKIKIVEDILFLRSDRAASRYYNEKALKDEDGWINTGDLVSFQNGRFYIVGRVSGIINIGGDKVIPEKIRETLLEHSDVLEVRVFGKKNPFTGMLLMAEVVVADTAREDDYSVVLKKYLEKKLPKPSVPSIIKLVDKIEIGGTGKMEYRSDE